MENLFHDLGSVPEHGETSPVDVLVRRPRHNHFFEMGRVAIRHRGGCCNSQRLTWETSLVGGVANGGRRSQTDGMVPATQRL
jgi:hypothetical protein